MMLVQIARSRASRDELARSILLDTVLPLSVLIALMTMIVWAGIRAGLAPLARLRALVEDRGAERPGAARAGSGAARGALAGAALNHLLAAVHESVAAQRRFISDAAHQLRTPLAGLKSQTELALSETNDPALARAPAARARERGAQRTPGQPAADAGARRTRIGHGARPRRVDLRAPGPRGDGRARAARAGSRHRPGLRRGRARPTGPPLQVRGHALLLREALVNLIDNAIRYAGRGAEVTVRVRAQGGEALVEVEDNGPGVHRPNIEHVFERFVRATHEATAAAWAWPSCARSSSAMAATRATAARCSRIGLLARLRLPLAADSSEPPCEGQAVVISVLIF